MKCNKPASVPSHRRCTLATVPLILFAVSTSGCWRPPQVAPENRKLIESLRTAISARQSQWLEETSKLVESQHAKRQMSNDEYATFTQVIAQARRGDWQRANKRMLQWAKAQRVTDEDLRRLQEDRAAKARATKPPRPPANP